ncbi:MAG: hypothetical protein WCC17_16410 [Candidatus Nitrosopolaris sp.]
MKRYANLIIRHDLSYEAAGQSSRGLLPTVAESVLDRRIMFKNLQKSFVTNSKEWLWCEQRIIALQFHYHYHFALQFSLFDYE